MLVVDISVAVHDYIFVMAGHLWTLYFDGGGLFIVWHLHGLYISYNTTVVLLIIGRISSQPTNQPMANVNVCTAACPREVALKNVVPSYKFCCEKGLYI